MDLQVEKYSIVPEVDFLVRVVLVMLASRGSGMFTLHALHPYGGRFPADSFKPGMFVVLTLYCRSLRTGGRVACKKKSAMPCNR